MKKKTAAERQRQYRTRIKNRLIKAENALNEALKKLRWYESRIADLTAAPAVTLSELKKAVRRTKTKRRKKWN